MNERIRQAMLETVAAALNAAAKGSSYVPEFDKILAKAMGSEWVDVRPQMTLSKFLVGGNHPEPLTGLVVQLESGEYLIGDFNQSGGCCGCCTDRDGEIVFKYKRVWDGEGNGTVAEQ